MREGCIFSIDLVIKSKFQTIVIVIVIVIVIFIFNKFTHGPTNNRSYTEFVSTDLIMQQKIQNFPK